jgi:glycosyltransferase involved in cell wall biosynthesis
MKLVYITACMPYGDAETFIISEIAELLRHNEVLVVPRSPGKLGKHAEWLAPFTRRETLISPRVLTRALRLLFQRPRQCVSTFRILLHSGSVKNTLRNLAVYPKALWLAAAVDEWKADHIHCHWAGTTATMAMIASKISGIPWSLTAHRSDIVSDNLLAEKAASATMVRTIAREGRKMMIARGVSENTRLRVLPMGVQVPASTPLRHPGHNVVLCPADLLPVKGHRFLIEAWKILRDRGVKAELWLAGSGELKQQLQALVSELGLADVVTFLGTVKHEDLLTFYKAGSISAVALASVDLGGGVHEGIPVALVEAMSYGVPVISTLTGGIPELVKPGTGLLVPPEDSAALADGLHKLLNDVEFARDIGMQGFLEVSETRNIVHIAAELEESFRRARYPFVVNARASNGQQWKPTPPAARKNWTSRRP